MAIYELDGIRPKLPENDAFWIADSAEVLGDVTIEADVSIWFQAVIRGDNDPIKIGRGSNVQEHTMIHTDHGFPVTIEEDVTIGHRAILHGCHIGAGVTIGMGAIILNGASIGKNAIIGAGALVPEGKHIPEDGLVVGVPGKVVRNIREDERERMHKNTRAYQENIARYHKGLKPILD